MVSALLLATSSLYSSHSKDYRELVKPYNNMVEKGYNRGPFIDSANRKYAYLGAPYCASSVSMILDRSNPIYPKLRSARAKAFITAKSVNATRIWEGKDTIPYNSLVIFTRKGGGHIEFYISNSKGIMRVFGFNTSPDGKAGSQWNGSWSGYKNRDIKKSLSPYNVFRVTHFTPVIYAAKQQDHLNSGASNPALIAGSKDLRQPSVATYSVTRHNLRGSRGNTTSRYSVRR